MLDFDTDDPRGLSRKWKVGTLVGKGDEIIVNKETLEIAHLWAYQCIGHRWDEVKERFMTCIMKISHLTQYDHPERGNFEWVSSSELIHLSTYSRKKHSVSNWGYREIPSVKGKKLSFKTRCKEDLGSPVKLSGVSKKVQLQFDSWQRAKTKRDRMVSSYILVWNDLVMTKYKSPCHSDMKIMTTHQPDLVGKLKHIYTAVWDMSKEFEEINPRYSRACKAFQKYFFLHSPFARFFKGQSLKGIFRDGLRLLPKLPSRLLMHIIIWTRFPWEYPDYIVTWKELVDRGVRPDVAMVTSMLLEAPASEYYRDAGDDFYSREVERYGLRTGHSPFDGEDMIYQDVIGLCNQEMSINLVDYSYEERLTYSRVWDVYGTGLPDFYLVNDPLRLRAVTCEFSKVEKKKKCEWSRAVKTVKRSIFSSSIEELTEYSKMLTEELGDRIC